MQILNKFSEKEKKLLFLLFTLIIVVLAYQFGYQTYARKAQDYNKMNEQLKTALDEKREKAAKKSFYEKETNSMEEEIENINSRFPSYLTQEAGTMFVSNLAEYAGMKVSSIAFEDMSIFYSPDGTAASGDNNSSEEIGSANEAEKDASEDAKTDNSASDTGNSEAVSDSDNTQQSVVSNLNSIGYKMGITITYQVSYEGLKKCMEYVKKEENRMNIRDLSAAFDNSTGNLTGTMTIDMYAYTGSGKACVEPDLNDVETGTDNIFGTFEVPID